MIRRILKKIFSFTMIFLISFICIFGIIPVQAAEKEPQTLGDLKQILADLKKQKAQNDAEKESTKQQIEAKKRAIRNAEDEITKAESDILKAEEKIQESNIRIEGLKEQTEKVLIALQQMQSQNAYLEYLTDASSITERFRKFNRTK